MENLLQAMHQQWNEFSSDALKLFIASVLGATIGWEREVHHKGAGLRTHLLICMGACLFCVVSLRMRETFNGDMLRLIQGMILGIGFLAGGVIFTQQGSVYGLTTAAGLWVLTAIGIAVGLGYYLLAVFATALSIVIIAWLKVLERRLHKGKQGAGPPEAGSQS
jgi:putative Mg2+ transporter-C (MgtC) family protein